MRWSSIARRRTSAVALAVAVFALLWILLSGGGDDEAGSKGEATDPQAPPSTTTASEPSAGPAGGLSTEELVDQVILAGIEGSDPSSDAIADLGTQQLGGVLIGSANWNGAGPGAKLIAAIRQAASKDGAIPPLIATDQEGGAYRTLTDLPPQQREIEIGDRGDPRLAERWGEDGGRALAGAGIDLNLAPVADVATLDSPIADRAFSDDPAVAAQMTAAAVAGCRDAGIACAVSHFPGLGAASQDTDQGPASVGLDPATLRSRDLAPSSPPSTQARRRWSSPMPSTPSTR